MAMNDLAKLSLAVAAGATVQKVAPTKFWWVIAGAAVVFIMNSPETRTAIGRGASKAAAGAKGAYEGFKSR